MLMNEYPEPPAEIKRIIDEIKNAPLTDEEKELIPVLAEQEERDRLQCLYAMHVITERRLMKELKDHENDEDINRLEYILNFINALTDVRAEMRRVIDNQIRLDFKEKFSANKV